MKWQILFILLFTCYTWYNIFKWTPQILSSPITCIALTVGLIIVIGGAISGLTKHKS